MSETQKAHGVSVIIPVLNEEKHLAKTVQSVLSQKYAGAVEIILTLGPSSDKTNEVAKQIANEHKNVQLLDNPRGLTTVGLNAAIKKTKYQVIARIDAHSEPDENYFEIGVRELLLQKADLIGGIMAAKGYGSFQKAVAWAYTSRFGIGGAKFHVGGKAGEAESAYLGIFQKSALERVGGYNEEIIRGEDWDLAQRIKASGGLVWFSPELRVTYWPRGNWKKLAQQFFSTGVWRGELTRQNPARASYRYWVPPMLVLLVATGLVNLATGNYLGIFPAALYLLGVVGIATTVRSLTLKSRIALVIVLPTMHFSWGIGFWRGYVFGARGNLDKSRIDKKRIKP